MFIDILYEGASRPRPELSDPESVRKCFAHSTWSTLSGAERREVLQALENICAAEQGRDAKLVVFRPMEGGLCGCWNEAADTITVNSNLVDHDGYSYKGNIIPMSDSVMQLYDTVVHEGYHAYQSYAMKHPEVHADKEQLSQWISNDAMGFVEGRGESNYYDCSKQPDMYRIQPMERDAFAYAEKHTRECFDAIEAEEGKQPGYEDYKHNCSINSYENALANEQAKDPAVLEHMDQEMAYRQAMWQQGQSCGPIGQGNYRPLSQQTQPQHYNTPQEGFNPDEGESVYVLGLGYNTVHKPSVSQQYYEGVQGLNYVYAGRFQDPQQMQQYQQEVAALQQSLNNFDPRTSDALRQGFEDRDALFREYMEDRIENADAEELSQLRDNMEALYQQNVIDASAYHEYMGPALQQQAVQETDMASYAAQSQEAEAQAEQQELSTGYGEYGQTAAEEETDMASYLAQSQEAEAQAERQELSTGYGEYGQTAAEEETDMASYLAQSQEAEPYGENRQVPAGQQQGYAGAEDMESYLSMSQGGMDAGEKAEGESLASYAAENSEAGENQQQAEASELSTGGDTSSGEAPEEDRAYDNAYSM